jgi:glycerophosphoryl diester phosphodiesterase
MNIIAHRGGASLAPENSIEAIKVSRSLGVDAAEIDIRLTRDSQLVVFHDKNLKRLAGVDKQIARLTLEEIRKIKLKNGSQIPSLAEVIAAAGDLPLVIEGKSSGWAHALVKVLEKYQYKDSLRVISFNETELSSFKKLLPDINCYILGLLDGFNTITKAKKNDFDGVDLNYLTFNYLVYALAKRNKLKVILYTPNSVFIVKFMAKFFPDVDITTDRPDKFLHLGKSIDE